MTTAAFFDLDGTILPAPSLERRFLRYLAWRGDLRALGWLRAAARALPLAVRANWSWETRDAGEAEWAVLAANNKAYLRNVPCWTMRAFCAWLERYPLPLLADARRRATWHLEQGHPVLLVTGSPAPLAAAVAREIHPRIEVLATQLECADGRWTGTVSGPAMAGITKARAIARLAAQRRWHLQNCFAYGDSWADRWMLARVGHPIAVNPSKRLERHARENGWPIARWQREAPAAQTPQPVPTAAALRDAVSMAADDRFVEALRSAARRNGLVVTALSQSLSSIATQAIEEPYGLHSLSSSAPARGLEGCASKPALG